MEKIYIQGDINNIRVGMRRISLSDSEVMNEAGVFISKNNNPVTVYDTSGAYGDASFEYNRETGLSRIRESWFTHRRDIVRQTDADGKSSLRAKLGKYITQMYYAKKRMITPEMEYVAIRENQQIEALGLKSYITPEFVRKEIASGRAVIPANINHLELEPMIVGSRFLVKINSRITVKSDFSDADFEKIRLNCLSGADMLTETSSENPPLDSILRNAPIPVGTIPMYQALAKVDGKIERLDWELYRDTLIELLEQGVDVISVHAAFRRKHIKMTAHRLSGIDSSIGKLLAKWMESRREENFMYVHFNDICDITGTYDTAISLGSCLSPGAVYDANDRAHLAELYEMSGLIETAWKNYVQVIAESWGNIPMNKIAPFMKEFKYACHNIPLLSQGVVTSDIIKGCENVSGIIGDTQMAFSGASVIGMPENTASSDTEYIRTNLRRYKGAAHAVDIAKGHPGAQIRDNAYRKALRENRTKDCEKLSFSSEIE